MGQLLYYLRVKNDLLKRGERIVPTTHIGVMGTQYCRYVSSHAALPRLLHPNCCVQHIIPMVSESLELIVQSVVSNGIPDW